MNLFGKHSLLACAAASFLLMPGCSRVPQPAGMGEVDIPAAWHEAAAQAAQDIPADWWTAFGSDELNSMISQALSDNLDLRAGLQRVAQARATAKIAGAPLLPSIDAGGDLSATRTLPPHGRTTSDDSWGAQIDVSYELDLFGARRAVASEAVAGMQAQAFDHEALRLVIMSDTAGAYFRTLNLRERVKIAQDNLDIMKDILVITEKRFEAGAASALDVAQQKTALSNAQAALASLERQKVVTENALAVLLGRAPQTITVQGDSTASLLVPAIAPSLPSALLERRPDIRAAERRLAGASSGIDAARAAFFPSISLGLGLSAAASPASAAATKLYDLVSALAMPVFSGGRLEGGIDKAQAVRAETAEDYKKTVLTAFVETENALTAVRTARERQEALKTAHAEAEKSYKLSRKMYDAGAIDFQTLLETQRSLLETGDSLATARLETLDASIDLFRALGGGWQQSL